MRRAAHHSSTFAYSFAFLPAAQREALAAVYSFCRASDDIVDAGSGSAAERAARLEAWGAEIDRAIAPDRTATDPVALALGDAVRTYRIAPRRPGDVAACYADPSRARTELGWTASLGVDRMCADTWRWQSMNPKGYRDVGEV